MSLVASALLFFSLVALAVLGAVVVFFSPKGPAPAPTSQGFMGSD